MVAKKNKKEQMKESYNQSAPFYDQRYREIQYQKFRYIFANSYLLQVNMHKTLDLGAGTGLFLEYFLTLMDLEYFSYFGCDLSFQMLLRFKRKNLSHTNHAFTCHLINCDCEHLPFRPNAFDQIISFSTLQNLGDQKQGLLESRRVLRTSGSFLFSILKKKLDVESTKTWFKMIFKGQIAIDMPSLLEDALFFRE